MHGKLHPDEKDRVMTAFAAGQLDVLVSTTVIEVGVDVPNATTMVIMDAERFGVSQLHQLRGRVGRGAHAGLCLLVTEAPADSAARERLDAVAETGDGFQLSRLDLAQRREGDVLGSAQAGRRSSLKLLRLLADEDLIASARVEATALVADDPQLDRRIRRSRTPSTTSSATARPSSSTRPEPRPERVTGRLSSHDTGHRGDRGRAQARRPARHHDPADQRPGARGPVRLAPVRARPFDGARVLDLYAGSGAIGLEALSRGADHVLLVESDARAAAVIKANVKAVDLPGATVAVDRVERLLTRPPAQAGTTASDRFDLVIADPALRR